MRRAERHDERARESAHFDPGALVDLTEASDWYAREAGDDVSARFEEAVTEAIARVVRTPFAYARLPDQDGARRVLVRDFPYSVIFMLREPGYWRVAMHPIERLAIAITRTRAFIAALGTEPEVVP